MASSFASIANDITIALAVLELFQGLSDLPDELREMTETAQGRLFQVSEQLRETSLAAGR